MRIITVSICAMLASTAAYAADLPTKKGTPFAPAKPSCFSDLLHYFDSSPADCPLSLYGLTLYATIDMGVGYQSHGAPFNGLFPTGVTEFVQKFGNKSQFLLTPNGLSQSQIGVKAKEPLAYGWSFVGEVGFGFDPYSLELANGPASMTQNTQRPLTLQNTNGDSSRAGQFDNSVGYAGLSHDVFGTLTVGRQNALTLDGVNAYDPMGGSYAFSPIGWSGKVAGAGSTENARINTSVRYNLKLANYRFNAMAQFGGYDLGNGSNGEWEVNVGGDFFNNALSVDAIYSRVKDQVSLGTYNGPAPLPDALTATLSNNDSLMLLAKYKWSQFTIYGGYEYIRYSNPSDAFAGGFTSIGGLDGVDGYPVTRVNSTNFTNPQNFNVFWTGVKYAFNDRVDITGAYYLYDQQSFTQPGDNCAAARPNPVGNVVGTVSGRCQGYMNAFSAMIDWRPLKRVDLYAGVMYSRVSGGLASGYLYSDNFAPTAGIRVRF